MQPHSAQWRETTLVDIGNRQPTHSSQDPTEYDTSVQVPQAPEPPPPKRPEKSRKERKCPSISLCAHSLMKQKQKCNISFVLLATKETPKDHSSNKDEAALSFLQYSKQDKIRPSQPETQNSKKK
ncbi:hypothetical protein AVEN_243527-1 [Araneus ventricosus]|uniref:Uncharacterized protein n=1 Tax=Araneus ventricosus TaxID=182803 RepID=A0A4Y2NTR4_ARAVE|nr:hypothetical protein AVEN_243527-1 [Araneus ventricosus]